MLLTALPFRRLLSKHHNFRSHSNDFRCNAVYSKFVEPTRVDKPSNSQPVPSGKINSRSFALDSGVCSLRLQQYTGSGTGPEASPLSRIIES
jgi:hypothetical protein